MNIIPIFVPHEGCRTRCTFCNENSATGVSRLPDEAEVHETVERYLSFFRDPHKAELAFYGGTFSGEGRQQMYLEIADRLFKKGIIGGIRFSTSPGLLTEETINRMRSYPITFVELGVQSFDNDVLRGCHRDHGTNEIYEAARLLRKNGIDYGIHLMTGLSGDCEAKDMFSTKEAIRVGASCVRLHPVVVLKGSILEEEYHLGGFTPKGIEESLEILWKMYLLLLLSEVKVSRVGICLYGRQVANVVAGPFHPALGELVRDRLMFEILREFCVQNNRRSLCLDRSNSKWFTGHNKGILARAFREGISISFVENGEDIDLPFYMKSIGERILGGVYAQA